MSAINVIRQKSAVHVLTDGAAYSDAGDFEFSISRVWPLPQINAAIAVHGPPLFPAMVATLFRASASKYDELRDSAAALLNTGMSLFGDLGKMCSHGADFEVV